MKRVMFGLYALLSYAVGMASLAWLAGFLLNLVVPKGIDDGPQVLLWETAIYDIGILILFLVPHSIMARPRFKAQWTRLVPAAAERATYILFSGVTLLLLIAFWRPLPAVLWAAESDAAAIAAYALYAFGWTMIVVSTFAIDHFSFFGLRQVWETITGRRPRRNGLSQSWFYAVVRHPISLGWIIVFFATPVMTVGHLLLASVMTVYILVVTPIEERDIEAGLGEEYRAYRQRVRAFLPVRRS